MSAGGRRNATDRRTRTPPLICRVLPRVLPELPIAAKILRSTRKVLFGAKEFPDVDGFANSSVTPRPF
jgi:hypothetical protein